MGIESEAEEGVNADDDDDDTDVDPEEEIEFDFNGYTVDDKTDIDFMRNINTCRSTGNLGSKP